MFGWAASVAVAGAWAISDGRPARIATETVDHFRRKIDGEALGDRVAALIQDDGTAVRAVRATSSRRTEAPRAGDTPRERPVEAVRPPLKPQVEARKADPRIPLPASAPLLPLAAPPVEYAMRQPRPLVRQNVGVAAAGEQRHATRTLAAHAEPDAASATLASVESGWSVSVLRSAGDWRYVRNDRSGVEGWVDGRFLAGEAMSADLATLSRQDLLHRR